MVLAGRLRNTTLGDLLGALHRGRASGELSLEEPSGTTHRLRFRDGRITAVETPLGPKLGEVLQTHSEVCPQALAQALEVSVRERRPLGTILLTGRFAPPDAVLRGLQRQLQARMSELETLSDARIRFHTALRPLSGERTPVELCAKAFLHGRLRARDRKPSLHRVPARASAAQNAGLRDRAWKKQIFHAHPDRHPDASPDERQKLEAKLRELVANLTR